MKQEMTNPITRLDYPDPDVIRVGDTYYMVSTTMHYMPGCEILRSYDLLHWEWVSYVYDTLDSTPDQRLVGEGNIYGQGMWAASLRYHKGIFYVCFVANDTHKTYLYSSESITGPWRKQNIEGFYHDCSLLFDDGDRVYIVYGNKTIYLTELEADLSGPKKDGLSRVVVVDEGHPGLGYEGSHLYKIRGKYYLFLIHSARDEWKRIEACFTADSLEGEFVGGDVLNDDMGYFNSGVAQGGIVDTPDGEWYGILFQDRAAVGRIPILVPVSWKDDFPTFGIDGKVPCRVETKSTRPEHHYAPLIGSDDFKTPLKHFWQWNHEPDLSFCSVDTIKGCYRIQTNKLCSDITKAPNTLTQRTLYPACEAIVTIDASRIKEGDYAGLSAFMGCYGLIGITKENGSFYLSMQAREALDSTFTGISKDTKGKEYARIPVPVSVPGSHEVVPGSEADTHTTVPDSHEVVSGSEIVTVKVVLSFEDQTDTADFYYLKDNEWIKIGISHKLVYKMDHFVGCRFGLFHYATKEIGGIAEFYDFIYNDLE